MSEILLHKYNHSKYVRHINSKRKQNQKLRFKIQQLKRQNKIKYKSPSQIKNKRSLRKIQQKQWSKENKRTKPKHDSFCFTRDDYHDCDYGNDSVPLFYMYEYVRPEYEGWMELNELTIFDPYFRDRNRYWWEYGNYFCECSESFYESLRLVTHLMTKTNFKKELQETCLLFNMETFDGQCGYLYYIMDKLGIIQQLFYTKCLQKIDKNWNPNLYYYKELVNTIVFSDKLNNKYLQCIWDDINFKVDSYLNVENHKYCKYVMLDKKKIINIINDNNLVVIGYDICSLILEFVMYANINDNLLYYLFDTTNIDAKVVYINQYNIQEHKVIDYEVKYRYKKRDYWSNTNIQQKRGKIYDGQDISKMYRKCKEHHNNNKKALFHHGQFDHTFNTILVLVWYKFKRYYMERLAFRRVGYKMLYALTLYFVRHRYVCRHLSWQLNIDSTDVDLWKKMYNETKNQPFVQCLLVMIAESIQMFQEKTEFFDIFQRSIEKIAESKVVSIHYFCQILKERYLFKELLFDQDCWINVLENIKGNVNEKDLGIIYKLAMHHYVAKYGNKKKGYDMQWKRITNSLMLSYNKMMNLNVKNEDYNNYKRYGMDKYSKKYKSKQIDIRKKEFRRKYRKYDAKRMNKRIQNKMRKYRKTALYTASMSCSLSLSTVNSFIETI